MARRGVALNSLPSRREGNPVEQDEIIETVKHEDKLGQVAMRIIAVSITVATIIVLATNGVDGFPYGWPGFVGAIILACVSFAVGQVE
jgi:hypothetical protein